MKLDIKPFAFLLLIFTMILTGSCLQEDIEPENNDTKDIAFYSLTIKYSSGGGKELLAYDVESNWSPDMGTIWLGNDKSNLPTGTLTIILTRVDDSQINLPYNYATVESVLLSTADVLVGTGAEINAKLYKSEAGTQLIKNIVIGNNYISGELEDMAMVEATTGDLVSVSGGFTAVSK